MTALISPRSILFKLTCLTWLTATLLLQACTTPPSNQTRQVGTGDLGLVIERATGKVAVINFFAVWCGHSRLHTQALTKYGEDETKRGLQIVGLAIDDAETTPQRVSEFIAQMKITYPVGLVTDDVFKKYVESKDLSVPQTLVYARDGKLVAHFVGHDESVAADLDAAIKRELDKQ